MKQLFIDHDSPVSMTGPLHMCNLMKQCMPGVYPLGQAVEALKKSNWGFFNTKLTWPHEIHVTCYSKEFAYVCDYDYDFSFFMLPLTSI